MTIQSFSQVVRYDDTPLDARLGATDLYTGHMMHRQIHRDDEHAPWVISLPLVVARSCENPCANYITIAYLFAFKSAQHGELRFVPLTGIRCAMNEAGIRGRGLTAFRFLGVGRCVHKKRRVPSFRHSVIDAQIEGARIRFHNLKLCNSMVRYLVIGMYNRVAVSK